ncbi:MAG: agmatinase [Clostridia bacterium]|nr:agmatinase [Clostridia bacterium]
MITKDKFAKDSGSWCGLNRPELSEKEVDAVIFGIPFDEAVSYRGGAGQGPKVMRENTFTSTPYTENFESFSALKVFDGGDFEFKHGQNREEYFKEISEYVSGLAKSGKFFTMIGGDHSTTIPVLRGIDKAIDEDFGIIHIDAHFDLCNDMDGDKLSHGSTQRRALELEHINGPENIYFIGIRSIEPDEYEFKKLNEIQVASAKDCFNQGVEKITSDVLAAMSKFNKIYITVDIDALDPGYAAGTGTPQFGGLTPRQLLDFLSAFFEKLNVIGLDIVEISPPLDSSLTSMFAGRKIVQETWGYLAKKIGKLNK